MLTSCSHTRNPSGSAELRALKASGVPVSVSCCFWALQAYLGNLLLTFPSQLASKQSTSCCGAVCCRPAKVAAMCACTGTCGLP